LRQRQCEFAYSAQERILSHEPNCYRGTDGPRRRRRSLRSRREFHQRQDDRLGNYDRHDDPSTDNTTTDDEDLAGDGTLGAFTFHGLRADVLTPLEAPATCATPLVLFPVVNGAGVFRFDDGSLLVVNITGGGICIDFAAGVAKLTETYEIARGTGRFKRASGALNLTVRVMPVLFNAEGGAQWLTMTGKFEGSVSGISR
jgi:hypothetical protein